MELTEYLTEFVFRLRLLKGLFLVKRQALAMTCCFGTWKLTIIKNIALNWKDLVLEFSMRRK